MRPSALYPTSIFIISLSIEITVPFTTLPSILSSVSTCFAKRSANDSI